jgi:ABC-type oligopeptide transport system substrate-binding subunit
VKRTIQVGLGVLAVAAALVVEVGFAEHEAGAAPQAPRGGTLRIGSLSDVEVDPGIGYTSSPWLVSDATCARWFAYRSKPGATTPRLVPEVVRSYAVSNHGRTYAFELRRSFRFHTGARVTAQSFVDAFNRVAQPRLGSPAMDYLREIVGAVAVTDGRAASIDGIRALGPYRLEIRLTKRLPDLPARLSMPFFCPVLPDTPPTRIHDPAGSGPYYVAERIENVRVVLKRNRYYGGDRPGNVDEIVWTIGQSLEACQLAVEEDREDFCAEPGIPRTASRALAARYGVNRPGGRFFANPSSATWFFAFNRTRPAFAGPGQIPLKKAINYAVDRHALAGTFAPLSARRTDQLLPPAFGRPASIYPLAGANPAVARRWYAKARVKPVRLVLYTWNLPHTVEQAGILAFDLKQLGIDLEVKYFDLDAIFERIRRPGEPFDLAIAGWAPDYPDGAGFFVPLVGDGPLGLALSDPKLRRRVEAANRLAGEARRRAWADLDVDLMRNDPPWVPVAHTQRIFFVSKSLGCFVPHPIVGVEITQLCKKP